MSIAHWTPSPDKDFGSAKRQYVEQFGSILVMNTYLKVALLVLCGVILGLVALGFTMFRSFQAVKPVVIRINDVGRAEAVRYDSFEYHPQENEIKFFLINFVELHFSRVRATAKENYARSLYFLDGNLADSTIEANKKTSAIESFLAGQGDEIEVHVNSVAIQDLRNPPYRATVDFEKIYYASGTREVSKRETYIGNFVFVVKEHVPNSMTPVNPLGLTIVYFKDDQAFK